MKDETSPPVRTPPVRRTEVFGAARGTRLAASRGRSAAGPVPAPVSAPTPTEPGRLSVRYPGENGEPGEVYARRSYSEPND